MEENHKLHLRVNDVPSFSTTILFAFQQSMLCISGLLVYPFLVSEMVCAEDTTSLRVQLIAATFVASGIATFLQSSFGLRLSILNGTAIAFLPPLLAYSSTHPCPPAGEVHEDLWKIRLQEISGSLMTACLSFIFIGVTGIAGLLSQFIGPITITPLMILLTISIVPTMEEKMSLHWISIVMLCVMVLMAIYMEHVRVPLCYYSFSKKSVIINRVPLFGQFPYLMSISLVWFICWLMTTFDLEPEGGLARTDRNETVTVLRQSPWFQIPYPGQFGPPRLDLGLLLGYVASCLASTMENIGNYDLAAKVSEERPPPQHAVNRAIVVEGVGSMLAASLGVSTGVTTYSENIALMHVTKVVSRRTMQAAGILLCLLGIFTKCAAVLASIPDALVGGILTMGISMIAGVTFTNLQQVDLKVTRNVAIMGLSLMLGLVVPMHISRSPIDIGSYDWNNIINTLLSIKMLVGGVVAVFLDNTVSGATLRQRGLHSKTHTDLSIVPMDDAYAFGSTFNRILLKFPFLRLLPIFPSPVRDPQCPDQV